MGAFMAMLHEWAEDDEDEATKLENVPDFIRERNMLIPIGMLGNDTKTAAKIVLPYGYNFFYQLGSNAYLMSRGKMSVEQGMTELVGTAFGSFNPLGAPKGETIAEVGLRLVIPTPLTPLVEMATNRNYFGYPIYKENRDTGTEIPDSHNTFKKTNKVFKWLTQEINELTGGNESESGKVDISADTISYFIGFGLGGAGSFGERAFVKPLGNIKAGKQPFEDYNDVPFVRRFLHEYTDDVDTESYYERRNKINQKMNHFKMPGIKDRSEYLKENINYLQFEAVYKQAEKQLKILRGHQKKIDEVIAAQPNRGTELAENQQKIQDAIDQIIRKTNKLYEDRVENK